MKHNAHCRRCGAEVLRDSFSGMLLCEGPDGAPTLHECPPQPFRVERSDTPQSTAAGSTEDDK